MEIISGTGLLYLCVPFIKWWLNTFSFFVEVRTHHFQCRHTFSSLAMLIDFTINGIFLTQHALPLRCLAEI